MNSLYKDIKKYVSVETQANDISETERIKHLIKDKQKLMEKIEKLNEEMEYLENSWNDRLIERNFLAFSSILETKSFNLRENKYQNITHNLLQDKNKLLEELTNVKRILRVPYLSARYSKAKYKEIELFGIRSIKGNIFQTFSYNFSI